MKETVLPGGQRAFCASQGARKRRLQELGAPAVLCTWERCGEGCRRWPSQLPGQAHAEPCKPQLSANVSQSAMICSHVLLTTTLGQGSLYPIHRHKHQPMLTRLSVVGQGLTQMHNSDILNLRWKGCSHRFVCL